jgi:hypothetical protein
LSASETVGFEMPTRREISAREIGAPSRIASSTVRSFRFLSNGGSAPLREPDVVTLSGNLTNREEMLREPPPLTGRKPES